MESRETGNSYQVIITDPAEVRFYEITEYFYEHYPLDRAEQIAGELYQAAQSLDVNPERGRKEDRLLHRRNSYRYILYKRTSRATVKIIYYVDQKTKTVYVADFFPTEKDDQKISKRNR